MTDFYDSAFDYRWTVIRSDYRSRQLLIRFEPADSFDSVRRPLYRKLSLGPNMMNESDIRASIDFIAPEVVQTWDLSMKNRNEYNMRPFMNLTGVNTHKPLVIDSYPALNPLRSKFGTLTITENAETRTSSYSIATLTDSEKADVRASLSLPMATVWRRLLNEGRLQTLFDAYGVDSFGNLDSEQIQIIRSDKLDFGDSVAQRIQTIYGYNDSDFASWMNETFEV